MIRSINANAEALRDKFVSHDGKKHLVVNSDAGGTRRTQDYSWFTARMAEKLREEVSYNDAMPLVCFN